MASTLPKGSLKRVPQLGPPCSAELLVKARKLSADGGDEDGDAENDENPEIYLY